MTSATHLAASSPAEEFALAELSTTRRASIEQEWNDLAARCEGSSYFQVADWVMSWWETVAGRPTTRAACWRAPDGTLEAIAILSARRARLHRRLPLAVSVLAPAGTGPGDADHCGPLSRPDRRADVAQWLATAARRHTVLCSAVAAEDGILPPGAQIVERTCCPRVALPARPASANFRRQLARRTRELADDGVTFTWSPSGSVLPETIEHLLVLHTRARSERGQTTSLGPEHRNLLVACARRADDRRGPAALIAAREGDVVGVLLGFWWQGVFGAYQSGWDRAYAERSLGRVMISEAMRAAADAGAHTFDFLRGAEAYKYRFGALDTYDFTGLVPHGAGGALLAVGGRWKAARARRQVRREEPAETERANRSPSLLDSV